MAGLRDAESGRLWNGASELAIRPKTLAVWRHLAENAGRLVTVGDLVHSVRADSHGNAPLVKGCVRELRKLLGDDPAGPRYIETVGRQILFLTGDPGIGKTLAGHFLAFGSRHGASLRRGT